MNYLLQQTELFAHFAKGDQSASQKKVKGRYNSWFVYFYHLITSFAIQYKSYHVWMIRLIFILDI